MELMRGLAFIALLFAGSAVGAELRQAEVCGDGTTHQSGYCPAVLSSASCSATGATTGSCSATSDEADGTRYVCATSNNTALTGAEIIECNTAAAVAGASAAETGSNSIGLTGLTEDAAHYGQIVNESPEGWYSNRLVPSSFTPTDSSDPYDLYATDSQSRGTIPFTVNWPTAPTITSEATVSTAAALETSLAVNGRRTIVQAGTYSADINLNGSDKELVLGAGVTINPTSGSGNFTINGDRIKISGNGGRINIGLYSTGAADVLIDNLEVYTQEGASAFSDTVEISGARRLAIINSDFYAWRYAGLIWDYQDIILANSRFRAFGSFGGSQATMRFAVDGTAGTYPDTRVSIVDCWFGNNSHHALRIHGHADSFWLRNITTSNGNGLWINPEHTGGNSYDVTNVWLYDSAIYDSTIAVANYSRLQAFTLDELSTYYTGYGGVSSQGDWSIGTENISSTQSAPAWSKL